MASGQQTSGAKPLQLARIEVEGLQRYSKEQIVEASGLKTGQTIDETSLDEAANKLLQTGFFTNLSYRVHASSNQATVTFVVEEKADRGVPVVFDNFVWFTNEELAEAIRREIPSYDGTALESGNVTESIKAILQRLLKEKKLPGEVEYMPADPPAHVFSVKGVKIPVCEINFPGASGIKESELRENAKPLFNDDYAHGFVNGFASTFLGNIYRERGYLRARFREATVKLMEGGACKNGVAVTLAVEEGPQYHWDKAEWAENQVLNAQELDAALGMKAGEVASSKKIAEGLGAINDAYGKKGYIRASLKPEPQYDDAQKTVIYRFKVAEGAQYHMGALSITGVPDETVAHLKSLWKLQPGAIYDASYPKFFEDKVMMKDASLAKALNFKPVKIGTVIKPDKEKLTVDVTIKFEP